jgi:peptidoglycan/xylan/chitin deacetylase (PgdA/CDA1 family)
VVQELKTLPNAGRLAAIDELRATASAPAARMRQLTADELRALVEGGVALGNHTLDHPCLHRCEPEEMLHQITAGGEALDAVVPGASRRLAYPNGYWDDRVLEAARASGVRLAFNFDHRTAAYPVADPVFVSRLRVASTMDPTRFALILSELMPTLFRARDRALGRPD